MTQDRKRDSGRVDRPKRGSPCEIVRSHFLYLYFDLAQGPLDGLDRFDGRFPVKCTVGLDVGHVPVHV